MKDDFRLRIAVLFGLVDPSDEDLFDKVREAAEKSGTSKAQPDCWFQPQEGK